jgi:hypothetical protein
MKKSFEKTLNENLNLPEEVKVQLKEAWDTQLSEARDEQAAELRQEFSQKFEHDKEVMAESVNQFLEDRLRVELTEFSEDKKSLAEEKVAYRKKLKVFESFIAQNLAKEIKELREDRVKANASLGKLEGFVIEKLSEEIKDLRSDKQALVNQRVKMVHEGKIALAETKKEFLGKAAKLVENNIKTLLRKEITQYREDIASARENDFGRRVFEAFAAEYMTSHLNEGSETKKLQKILSKQKDEIKTLSESVQSKSKLVESADRKAAAAKDSLSRDRKMHQLLSPLSGDKKAVMKDLLESVKTERLEKSFNKYLPAVLNESQIIKTESKSSVLNEGLVEKTGDRATVQDKKTSEGDQAIAEMRRLAGLNNKT